MRNWIVLSVQMIAALAAAAVILPASASAAPLDVAGDTNPTFVATDSAGRIYATNNGALLVHRYAATGAALGSFGGFGTGQGQFGAPIALETDTDDHIFVADLGDRNLPVQEFTPEGAFVRSFGTPEQGQSLDVAPGGDDVFVLRTGGYVYVYDAVTASLKNIWSVNTATESASMVFNPANGHLYVAGVQSREVEEFTTDGTSVRTWTVAGRVGDMVESIAADADGNVYTIERSGISRYDATGTPTGTYALGGSDLDVVGDQLYVATGQVVRRMEIGAPMVNLAVPPGQHLAGQAIGLTATTEVPFGSVERIAWDLDGDGSYETDSGGTPTAMTRFASPGTHVVRVRVTATSGKSAESTLSVTVAAPPSDQPPALGPTPPAGPVGVSINVRRQVHERSQTSR